MTGIILSISSDRGPGHVLLTCDDFCEFTTSVQWQVRRNGFNASYLGDNGWQIAPFSLKLDFVGRDQFLMEPGLVQYMEPLTNYTFQLIDNLGHHATIPRNWQ